MHFVSTKGIRTLGTVVAAFAVLICSTTTLYAQEGALTLTVTPPLFQLNLQPGETWTSGIQVVNANPYDLTLYAEPVLFKPAGESGRPQFFLPDEETGAPDSSNIASWITTPQTGIAIQREQTYVLPIAITVPEDAAPGGHYAAILIGNRPPEGAVEGGSVSVTSSIASLIFLRVAGDVLEKGQIREFSTEKSLYQDAEARFTLRFENKGNVHVQPQGDITIYNMFGKKRGYIQVNQEQEGEIRLGNVLPESTRTYAFTWKSDTGSWDIGRYRAEATLGYGNESKQFENATVYFYVLPIMPLLQMLGSIVALLWLAGWMVRAYVRRTLALEGAQAHADAHPEKKIVDETAPRDAVVEAPQQSPGPREEAAVDLRSSTPSDPEKEEFDARIAARARAEAQRRPVQIVRAPVQAFFHTYRFFFVFVVLVACGWLAASAYFADVLTYERDYEVQEEKVENGAVPVFLDGPPTE